MLPEPRFTQPTALNRWMVVLTFWLLAVAPLLSHAFGSLTPPGSALCSASTSAGTERPGEPLQQLLTHCPLCALQAQQDLAPPPAAQPLPLRQDVVQTQPARFLRAAATAHVWRSRLARAPPPRG